jgi:hypothetical protein
MPRDGALSSSFELERAAIGYADGAGMRRTEVRPMCNRRAISALLTPARCSFRTSALCSAAVGWSAQALAVLPSVRQASPSSFPQNLLFELSEYGQQAGHRSTSRRGQIQRLRQRNEADAEVLQFLERRQQGRYRSAPAIQAPDQHDVDLPTARCLQ